MLQVGEASHITSLGSDSSVGFFSHSGRHLSDHERPARPPSFSPSAAGVPHVAEGQPETDQ